MSQRRQRQRFAKATHLAASSRELRDLRGFAAPATPLWKQNAHPRDVRIVYYNNKYIIDNACCWEPDAGRGAASHDREVCPLLYTSVEQYVDQFFVTEFDEEDWAQKLSERADGKYADMEPSEILEQWKEE